MKNTDQAPRSSTASRPASSDGSEGITRHPEVDQILDRSSLTTHCSRSARGLISVLIAVYNAPIASRARWPGQRCCPAGKISAVSCASSPNRRTARQVDCPVRTAHESHSCIGLGCLSLRFPLEFRHRSLLVDNLRAHARCRQAVAGEKAVGILTTLPPPARACAPVFAFSCSIVGNPETL